MRTHNLRYSSAVNDFSQLPPQGEKSGFPVLDAVILHLNLKSDSPLLILSFSAADDATAVNNHNHRSSELSEEA